MAGRKQHFIPQALQRGFGLAKGKKTQVYVFKKGQEPYRSSTEGVAAQRDFYSEPSDELSLDDKITAYEGQVLAPAIAALREAPVGPVDSHVAAAVVVHLSIRSGFVRGSLSAVATDVMDYFAGALSRNETARALLEVDSLESRSVMINLIEEDIQLKVGAISEISRNALVKLMHFRAREKFPKIFPELVAMFLLLLKELVEKVPEIIVDGHSKVLDMDMAPALRVERLSAMSWRIVLAEPPAHFVLPDCLAIGFKTSDFQEMVPYSLLGNEELAGVIMPICSSKVLVGCFDSPEIDVASLNKSFAKCSMDFFISSVADPGTAEAAEFIGSTVSKYVNNTVGEQCFDAPDRSCFDGERLETAAQDDWLINIPIEFEPKSKRSGKAQAAVLNLLGSPELRAGLNIVRAIVIADNIVSALRKRGVVLNDYAAQFVRFGTCYVIEVQDGLSCELFFTTSSVNLVTNGHPFARAASVLIRHQAGRANYYASVVSTIPKETLKRPRPLLETVELGIAHSFCSHYFGGRLSGIGCISDEEFSAIDEICSKTLIGCIQGINDARTHFIKYRDVDAALCQILMYVEQLLCATANACASTDGEVGRWKVSKSVDVLRWVSLDDWFDLFALDLRRLFDCRKDLGGDADLVLLASHIERVLWSLGIVLSMSVPEQIWMDVLGDEQLESTRLMLRA